VGATAALVARKRERRKGISSAKLNPSSADAMTAARKLAARRRR
jgi:hypothetical protein